MSSGDIKKILLRNQSWGRISQGSKARRWRVARVAVVEDEPSLRALLKTYLERAGFAVVAYADGGHALKGLSIDPPDVAILDILLPEVDGLTILDAMRKSHPHMGVIMLTALSEVSDRIQGLKAGADDYIVKPFAPAEVVVRVETILRRMDSLSKSSVWRAGPVVLNTAAQEARVNDVDAKLTAMEYRLLYALMRQPKHILTRDQLLDVLHGPDGVVSDRTIDVHVTRLRKKLGLRPSPIRGVYGLGYQWIGEIPVVCDT